MSDNSSRMTTYLALVWKRRITLTVTILCAHFLKTLSRIKTPGDLTFHKRRAAKGVSLFPFRIRGSREFYNFL